MRVILNIGLATEGGRTISGLLVYRQLCQTYSRVYNCTVHTSDTERTVVAEVEAEFPLVGAHLLCRRLHQECVAVYAPLTGDGALEGPKAKEWGEFNRSLFLLLDGTRLSEKENAK